jgi:hypothetical protein
MKKEKSRNKVAKDVKKKKNKTIIPGTVFHAFLSQHSRDCRSKIVSLRSIWAAVRASLL